jgi:hypothetical protein
LLWSCSDHGECAGWEQSLVELAVTFDAMGLPWLRFVKTRINLHKQMGLLLKSAGALLFLTAIVKIYSIASPHVGRSRALLLMQNPIFPVLSERTVLFISVVVELWVGIYSWRPPPTMGKFGAILGLSTVLFLYHFAVAAISEVPPCHCLGILHGPLLALQDKISVATLGILGAVGVMGFVSCLLSNCLFKDGVARDETT